MSNSELKSIYKGLKSQEHLHNIKKEIASENAYEQAVRYGYLRVQIGNTRKIYSETMDKSHEDFIKFEKEAKECLNIERVKYEVLRGILDNITKFTNALNIPEPPNNRLMCILNNLFETHDLQLAESHDSQLAE